ncbi:YggT family protein [Candidatus Kaiserbacteria bacterium]|nr:YggT family protein [Candidatus Kaiserbacteria bacterium]
MNDVVYYEKPTYWYYPAGMVGRIVNTVFGIISFLLVVRLALIFVGADAQAPFVAWMYSLTGSLVAPFAGSFPTLFIGSFALELSTLFALIGYAIIGWLVMRLISMLFTAFNSATV